MQLCTSPWLRKPPFFTHLLCSLTAIVAAIVTVSAAAQTTGMVTAKLVKVTPKLKAYARVEPINTVPVNAAATGTLFNLRVVPGTHVRAGEVLARLQGPAVQALLLQDEANLRSAHAQLAAAEKTLAIQHEQLRAHLSTRAMVHQAEGSVAKAQAAFDDAQSRLAAARQMTTIVAPTNATVLALNSADGELVNAGQPVITLQPIHALWLLATYYGRNLNEIHAGMTGQFDPSDGSPSIPVRVRAVLGVMSTGGGESVAMTPLQSGERWLNGEFGTVKLTQPVKMLVAVPTRALILNQGKWWVMIHTARGDHAQEVVPGPVDGWNTFITHGVAPGSQVVVNNAYLLFHASISEHFEIPD